MAIFKKPIKIRINQRILRKHLFAALILVAMIQAKPNFVIFQTDDQPFSTINYFAKEYYGASDAYTPNIDELAKSGIVFEKAYAAAPTCAPSRCAMLTGRYPGRNAGLPEGTHDFGNDIHLDKDGMNLQNQLKKGGYTTGIVGKWHLGYLINKADKFATYGLTTYPQDSDPKVDTSTNNAMRENNYKLRQIVKDEWGWDYAESFYNENMKELLNDACNVHNIDHTVSGAVKFINQNKDNNFFLYFNTTMTHGPNPGNTKNGKLIYSVDADPRYSSEGYLPEALHVLPSREDMKARAKAAGIPNNMAYTVMLDDAVGAVIQKLKDIGQYENTIFIFTTDQNNTNYGKSTLYDNGVHVPLIISWPGKINPGVSNELVGHIDLAATFYDYAGVTLPNKYKLDGKSLRPFFEGNLNTEIHKSLFLEFGQMRGVVTKNAKYLALRYPKEVQDKIDQGIDVPLDDLRYNFRFGDKAAETYETYFDKDQLFDFTKQGEDVNLLYNSAGNPKPEENLSTYVKELRDEMKLELTKYLQTFEGDPFYEFYDGDSQTVDIKSVNSSKQTNANVKVFLKGNEVIINGIAIHNNSNVKLSVFNSRGQQVLKTLNKNVREGNIHLRLPQTFAPGIYYVQTMINKKSFMNSVVIDKK